MEIDSKKGKMYPITENIYINPGDSFVLRGMQVSGRVLVQVTTYEPDTDFSYFVKRRRHD